MVPQPCRSRCTQPGSSHRGWTQVTESPENPGRFSGCFRGGVCPDLQQTGRNAPAHSERRHRNRRHLGRHHHHRGQRYYGDQRGGLGVGWSGDVGRGGFDRRARKRNTANSSCPRRFAARVRLGRGTAPPSPITNRPTWRCVRIGAGASRSCVRGPPKGRRTAPGASRTRCSWSHLISFLAGCAFALVRRP